MEYLDLDIENKSKRDGRYYSFYRIDNLLLMKSYWGISYSKESIEDRNYKSSSSYRSDLKTDYRDHPEHFRLTVLQYYSNLKDLAAKEREVVTYSKVLDPSCYNQCVGGLIGPLDLTSHRLKLDLERSKLGQLTSVEKSSLSKKESFSKAKRSGEDNYLQKITKERVLNNKLLKSLGELTSGDKSGLAKKTNCINSIPWADCEVTLYKHETSIFRGRALDACKFIYGERRYLSERKRFEKKLKCNGNWGVRKNSTLSGIRIEKFND